MRRITCVENRSAKTVNSITQVLDDRQRIKHGGG